jgi:hypothetical protein
MPFTESLSTEPRVLVVHVNPSVGAALVHRLADTGLVALGDVWSSVDALDGDGRCDVVVLCPYLTYDERDAILEACGLREHRPSVLELTDDAVNGARLRPLWLEPSEDSSEFIPRAVQNVIDALAPVCV